MVRKQLQVYEISDNENQLSLLYLNIISLYFHFDELLLTMKDFQTQSKAISLTENWLTEEYDYEQLKSDEHQAVRAIPWEISGKKGGIVF